MLRAFVLEMDPARFVPSLSVQTSWNGAGGIVRGQREQGRPVEDHVVHSGRRVYGARLMRRGVWDVATHRQTWQRAHPGRPIAAWVGNGNLLANPHFVAFSGGVLYSLAGEPLADRAYTCLVVRGGVTAIETLRAQDFGPELEFATFGQQIVCQGRPISRADLIRKATAGEFADLRHLFLFPRLPLGPERWMDAGLAAFYDDSGRQAGTVIEAALRGEAVAADVSWFPDAAVHHALAVKGYRDYELRGGILRFVPRPGIYPHNMVGASAGGLLVAVGLEGLSNRAGVSVERAAELMAQWGAQDALILDNGADVTMGLGSRTVLPGRSRLRSVIFFHGGPGLPRLARVDLPLRSGLVRE
jgi:hypothetical protein